MGGRGEERQIEVTVWEREGEGRGRAEEREGQRGQEMGAEVREGQR